MDVDSGDISHVLNTIQ